MQIRTTRQLIQDGYSTRSIARHLKSQELVRVTRGHYTEPWRVDHLEDHRQLILAVADALPDDAVISHESAAVLHGLPLPAGPIGPVRVLRQKRPDGGGRESPNIRCRRTDIPAEHRTAIILAGRLLQITTAARTVAELALQSLAWGVAAGDAAVHRGDTTSEELAGVVSVLGRRRGIARARQLVAHLDPRAESPAESLSRVHLAEAGIPTPELQLWVGDDERRLARLDFGWPEFRVAGECDGLAKYHDPAHGSPTEALRQEKFRESSIADLGWTMVRWMYPEIFDHRMVRRVAQALVRNGWDGRSER